MHGLKNIKGVAPNLGAKDKFKTITPSVHFPVNKAAYERKKQRAKDGRVRLNDAIEKLSISISVAGSQSKRRAELTSMRWHSSTNKIVDECVKTCEAAKKWDRPSFIDTAATLIRQLNDQCAALEREVLTLKKHQNNEERISSEIDQKCPTEEGANTAKRRKIETKKSSDQFQKIINHDIVLGVLASFLDPLSLTRSICVSRCWRSIAQFKCDASWNNLCLRRFGVERVISWELKANQSLRGKNSLTKMEIYRQMNLANVSPQHLMEGNVCLGDGKAKGVSAWASMQERSNGETLRSVKQFPEKKLKNTENTVGPEAPTSKEYRSIPVIELRIILQNTGNEDTVVVPDQVVSVDACTRRKGEEMKEITSDSRLEKSLFDINGSRFNSHQSGDRRGELFHLKLFDSVTLVAHIFARGCSTSSKFRSKAKFMKVLFSINGTTVPVVIPFSSQTAKDGADSKHD